MSVVAVRNYKDKIIIGADSQVTRGAHLKENLTKLFIDEKTYIWGTAGSASEMISYQIFLKTRHPASSELKDIREHFIEFIAFMSEMDGVLDMQNDYILIFDNKVFLVQSDLFIREIVEGGFESIGIGWQQANMGFYLGHNVEETLNAVCNLDIYCGLPLLLKEIKKD